MLGEIIQLQRTKCNLSRTQLAKRTGLTSTYIYQLEKGLRRHPSAIAVVRLATALGVEPTDLLKIAADLT